MGPSINDDVFTALIENNAPAIVANWYKNSIDHIDVSVVSIQEFADTVIDLRAQVLA